MALLPSVLLIALAAVTVWFFWPIVSDPILRVVSGRRAFSDDADSTADVLFRAWSDRA